MTNGIYLDDCCYIPAYTTDKGIHYNATANYCRYAYDNYIAPPEYAEGIIVDYALTGLSSYSFLLFLIAVFLFINICKGTSCLKSLAIAGIVFSVLILTFMFSYSVMLRNSEKVRLCLLHAPSYALEKLALFIERSIIVGYVLLPTFAFVGLISFIRYNPNEETSEAEEAFTVND